MRHLTLPLSLLALAVACFGLLRSTPAPAPSPRISTVKTAVTHARMTRLEEEVAGLRAELEQLRDAKAVVVRAPSKGPTAVRRRDGAPAQAELEEAIAQRVEARINAKADARPRNGQGEWQAPIDELAEELALEPEQREAVTEIFNAAREDVFSVLSTRRPDGGSLVDDMVARFKDGASQEEAGRALFQSMFQDKVPGTERTYFSDIMAVRGQVEESLAEALNAEQRASLKRLRIDPLQVQTGSDPMRAYVTEKLEGR